MPYKINLNKYLFLFFVFSRFLYAESFYINEPVLNTQVYVQTYGNKNNEPIVFVHGLGDEASTIWNDSIELLKNDYYILTFDLPGFGKSSKENKEYTPLNYALFINYIVSKYLDKKFYLIGHSMGAAISLKYTSLYGNNIKRLMLIDAAGILYQDSYSTFLVKAGIDSFFKDTPIIEKPINKFFSSITNTIQKVLPKDLTIVLKSELLREMFFNSNPTIISAVGLVMEDYSKVLDKINVPTYILWGEKDDIAPIRTAYILNKLIKNSQLSIIKDSKHIPMLNFKNDYFKNLSTFLNDEKILQNKNKSVKFEDLYVYEQSDSEIQGDIDFLVIENSNNIVIRNSNIKNLKIYNSNVKIINSEIKSDTSALIIKSSDVQVTSTNITSKQSTVLIDSSKIDFAGCNLNSDEYAIKDINNIKLSKLIFSITKINSLISKDLMMHKSINTKNIKKL